jgi:nicotinamide mononucleotide transporter
MFDAILSILQNEFHWSILETLAVIFSVIYVILATKENIWCWAAALISVGLYIYICYQAKLYAETGLQVFYFIMAIYGYFSWSKNDGALMISEWSTNKHFIIILSATLITFLLGFIFSIYTDAKMPIVDSFTTVFSVFATFMVVKKILSNWLYFIVIDVISIHLYYSRDLHLTSFLFLIYTLIAIFGFLKWNRILQKHE